MTLPPPLDPETISQAAGALGVAEAFVEKDWHVTRILKRLAALQHDGCRLAFGGGTSLSKAYGLIDRFSEDIDFRVVPTATAAGLSDNKRKRFRKATEAAVGAAGYRIDSGRTQRHHGNRTFVLYVPFEPVFPVRALRPDVKIEVTFEAMKLPEQNRPVRSLLARFRADPHEIGAVACVDPVETAADKLAALSWRVYEERHLPDEGERRRDQALVRHVHDLHALEKTVGSDGRFAPLVRDLVARDAANRGKNTAAERPVDPNDLLIQTCGILGEAPFPGDYERFVASVSHATEVPGYAAAVAAVGRLATLVRSA